MTEDNYWTKQLSQKLSRRRALTGGAVLGAGFLDAACDGGRPITAADAVASIQRWGKKAPAGVALFSAVNSLQAQGDHAFVLETKEPYSILIDSLTLGGGGPFIMTKEAAATPTDQ